MRLVALRGAHSVYANDSPSIDVAVRDLCAALLSKNQITPADVVSALFTLTPDLDAAFPAQSARHAGWGDVPMLCAREIGVPGAPERIVRVLVHAQIPMGREPRHVYLGQAQTLRPDLVGD